MSGPLALALLLSPFASAALGENVRSGGETSGGGTAQASVAVEVARMSFLEGEAEVQRQGGPWVKATEGQALSIGDRIQTLRGGTARLEFPWTAIAMGDASEVTIEKGRVLTVRLETGRIDIDPEQTLIRVVTAEASLSGAGRTLVRREGTTTFVGSYNGGAEVEGRGKLVRLGINRGTVVKGGAAPSEPALMAPAPRVVSPSADPRYVRPLEVVHLIWTGQESSYHLEVLSIDSDVPVVSLDLEATEYDLKIPWLGTFRWRVSGRLGPVETQSSAEGLICVVEK